MSNSFNNDKPIFIQVREIIEDQIVNGLLAEEEQAPSTNQLVSFYKINHATVAKGINQLVDEGILYKKRGIGMFISKGAKDKLMDKRRKAFSDEYVVPLVQEASKLGISIREIINLINQVKGSDNQ
ncbi:GntR family transcriptional regulator [Sedimentibacter sp.]|uniref:GntR family transcriptional regulator n=1 Tax=Sedimentibacter sp. TaxID=1960295 RepID=UPI0028A24D4A|nr:GntR family transcriptional regulator [Sedimentibacter sp.]